jgi:hypothetical protein
VDFDLPIGRRLIVQILSLICRRNANAQRRRRVGRNPLPFFKLARSLKQTTGKKIADLEDGLSSLARYVALAGGFERKVQPEVVKDGGGGRKGALGSGSIAYRRLPQSPKSKRCLVSLLPRRGGDTVLAFLSAERSKGTIWGVRPLHPSQPHRTGRSLRFYP